MNNEREDQEPAAATTSDWLDESIAFLAANLDLGFNDYGWLSASEAQEQHDVGSMIVETLPPTATTLHHPSLNLDTSVASSAPMTSQQELGQPKKRKSPGHSSSQRPHVVGGGRGGDQQEKGEASCVMSKPSKKGSGKGTAANSDREARWAEQLLNPCAAAIEAGNLPRTQLYMAKRAARHGTGTGTDRHGTTRHGMLAVPCLIVPPCRLSGPGTALSWLRRAVPCHWARQPVVLVPALALKVPNTSETSEF